jgi:hypothetical protein
MSGRLNWRRARRFYAFEHKKGLPAAFRDDLACRAERELKRWAKHLSPSDRALLGMLAAAGRRR